jgi:hypothetical protein
MTNMQIRKLFMKVLENQFWIMPYKDIIALYLLTDKQVLEKVIV